MRVDKNYPHQIYEDFWDWLNQHPIWILGLIFAYLYYLTSTEEIRRY